MDNNDFNNLYNQNQQNSFTDYNTKNTINDDYINMMQNEVSYNPPRENICEVNKKHNFSKILKIAAAVVCALGISIGSVSGYIALSNRGVSLPFSNSSKAVSGDNTPDTTQDTQTDSNAITPQTTEAATNSKDMPTLLQLAAREDALPITEIVTKVTPSVVGVTDTVPGGTQTGTGIIMSEDGYIITNAHVVNGSSDIKCLILKDDVSKADVSNSDNYTEVEAKLIGIDVQTDLAVLKVDQTGLTPAEFGKSEDLQVGELAIAIGNPLGFDFASSVTGGMISGLNRKLSIENRTMTLIQTDAAINNGNSGGPLVNSYGQVIGINSAKISQTDAESLGFAIPIDEAKPVIDDLIAYGYVKGRPFIGITGQDITEVWASYYDLPQGVSINSVTENSGAEKAGLKARDIIIGIDGNEIKSMAELNSYKDEHKAGDTVKLHIFRAGQTFDVDVVLSESQKPQSTTEDNSQEQQQQQQKQQQQQEIQIPFFPFFGN